jgi:hypothetical protein
MGILSNENAISGGNYQISNSLRFQSASSQYLSRTPSTTTNTTTWTWSAWVKRGTLGITNTLFFAGVSGQPYMQISFGSGNGIEWQAVNPTNVVLGRRYTTQVFRDPSAWYHVVVVWDTSNATAGNRMRLYINGSQVTAFSASTDPSLNQTSQVNTGSVAHYLGNFGGVAGNYFDGYLTEVNFIDGQALTPSSFGTTDPTSGQWVANKYTGAYGTNGFYLPFSNGTSTTTLGADSSGNGNNWTLNNFTRSAGVSDCWMTDVPSGNSSVGGNYAVLNPIYKSNIKNAPTLSNGNLTTSASYDTFMNATIAIPSAGKWYWEATVIAASVSSNQTGIGLNTSQGDNRVQQSFISVLNDIWGVALDAGTNSLAFYKNNVLQTTTTTPTGLEWFPFFYGDTNSSPTHRWAVNFGQRSFAYTPPSGFKALCTANLPVATIKQGNKYMDATLYTGNGGTQTITNAGGFSPDLVWIKTRSMPYNNLIHDSVRGVLNLLIPNGTDAEQTITDGITSFNSNGFTLGANGSYNQSTRSIVAWQWDAGSSTVTNTNGTISSQVRANPTAGFSVVTYTGTGANATVGHGLGVAPKRGLVNSTGNWPVYHAGLTSASYVIYMNLTNAQASNPSAWNSTAPTSNVFSIGVDTDENTNTGTYVAYCFAEIAGFSKFGSYTGNGSADGSFVYLGFRPKFVMIKRTDVAASWIILDTIRDTYNVAQNLLYPNQAVAEGAGGATKQMDIISNGFKLRGIDAEINASGGTYIYMAFAESPFQNSNSR